MTGLFGKSKTPKMPKVNIPDAPDIEIPEIEAPALPKPIRMPTEQDPQIQAAAKRLKDKKRGRGGRLSTILTDAAARS